MLRFISLTVGPRNPELFSKLYKGLVRPILEYCYLVWPPHLKKDSATNNDDVATNNVEHVDLPSETLAEIRRVKSALSSLNGQLYIREDYFLRLPSATRRFTV